ncbi:hypothetical protein M0811_10603 [Anaeramoeba ignava]|uniref:Uncharacterized protein n=1 Tax=Anaeramoeba ignava TaxID=1746090 RepID=A0A9Q0LEX0_ANAIG|nr:hypothetical protein M0811_10603 [Anaeramoeba ignava]
MSTELFSKFSSFSSSFQEYRTEINSILIKIQNFTDTFNKKNPKNIHLITNKNPEINEFMKLLQDLKEIVEKYQKFVTTLDFLRETEKNQQKQIQSKQIQISQLENHFLKKKQNDDSFLKFFEFETLGVDYDYFQSKQEFIYHEKFCKLSNRFFIFVIIFVIMFFLIIFLMN